MLDSGVVWQSPGHFRLRPAQFRRAATREFMRTEHDWQPGVGLRTGGSLALWLTSSLSPISEAGGARACLGKVHVCTSGQFQPCSVQHEGVRA
eukprot:gene15930-biopygen12765